MNKLRLFGLLLLNIVVAIIGTAVLDTPLRRTIPPHTVSAEVWKEMALSIICASLLGFAMWRTWRSEPAKWTWVVPSLWFGLGLLAFTGRGALGPLWVSPSGVGAAEMRSFFAFTIPLIRAVAYSVGAYISSKIYPSIALAQ